MLAQGGVDAIFESAVEPVDQFGHKCLAALNHHDELKVIRIHVVDVDLAEITSVDDEANTLVVVRNCLVYKEFELTDVINGARVAFIEQRHLIGFVVGDGKIKNRASLIDFGLAEFNKINISRLAVLIS